MRIKYKNVTRIIGLIALMFACANVRADSHAVSEQVTLLIDAEKTSFWRTLTSDRMSVWWDGLDEEASSATLTVSGKGFSKSWTDLTGRGMTVELPPVSSSYEENVYTVTVSFDTGFSFSERIGSVVGATADGSPSGILFRNSGNERAWAAYKGETAVVPVPFGTTELTVDSTPVETGLEGKAGWYLFGPKPVGTTTDLALTIGEDDPLFASVMSKGIGFMLLFR